MYLVLIHNRIPISEQEYFSVALNHHLFQFFLRPLLCQYSTFITSNDKMKHTFSSH